MRYSKQPILVVVTPLLLAAALISAPSLAAETNGANQNSQTNQTVNTSHKGEAQDLINKATQEVRTMEADPQLKQLLDKAKGVFLVPEFGRGALIVAEAGLTIVNFSHNGQASWGQRRYCDVVR